MDTHKKTVHMGEESRYYPILARERIDRQTDRQTDRQAENESA